MTVACISLKAQACIEVEASSAWLVCSLCSVVFGEEERALGARAATKSTIAHDRRALSCLRTTSTHLKQSLLSHRLGRLATDLKLQRLVFSASHHWNPQDRRPDFFRTSCRGSVSFWYIRMLARRLLSTTASRLATMSYPKPSTDRVQDLKENIEAIRAEMTQASSSDSKLPTLVLVSKLKPPSDLMAAYENLKEEDRHFGENYVQEVCVALPFVRILGV